MYPDDSTRLHHMRDAAREALAFAEGKRRSDHRPPLRRADAADLLSFAVRQFIAAFFRGGLRRPAGERSWLCATGSASVP